MSEEYFVQCDCGSEIRVELFDAGTSKTCPSCQCIVPVPGSDKLKELSGDKYPYLRPIEKLQQALAEGMTPFDGYCHVCSTAHASQQIPILFSAMVERHARNNGGVSPTISGGLAVHMGAAEELWQLTTFPLLLCTNCHSLFESAKSEAKLNGLLNRIMGGAIFCFALYVIARYADATIASMFVIAMLVIARWRMRHTPTKQIDPFALEWINRIRWVPEVLAAEDEYKLTLGQPRPWPSTGN